MNKKKKIIYIIFFILFSNLIASNDSIFFIYNSKDDFYTIISDTFHKSLKPSTYPCQLCKLTYNTFTKKAQWKEYLSRLEHPYHFLYKEDLFIALNKINEFPVILIGSNKSYKVLLSKKDINANKTLESLMNMIDNSLIKHKKFNLN